MKISWNSRGAVFGKELQELHQKSISATSSMIIYQQNTRHVNINYINILTINFVLQSLDYDICENRLMQNEERTKGYKFLVKKRFARWVVFFFIGVITALIACCIDIAIEELSAIKFYYLKHCKLSCSQYNSHSLFSLCFSCSCRFMRE